MMMCTAQGIKYITFVFIQVFKSSFDLENLVGIGAAGKIESAGTAIEAAESAGNEAETGEEGDYTE